MIYDNYKIECLDGKFLSFTNKRHAEWYVKKDLATFVNQDTIKLNFQPKNNISRHPSYLQKFDNRCVVCGKENKLTKHHVVPKCFKRFFRHEYKIYTSHDVLAACSGCHTKYERLYAKFLIEKLFKEYNIDTSYNLHINNCFKIVAKIRSITNGRIKNQNVQRLTNELLTKLPKNKELTDIAQIRMVDEILEVWPTKSINPSKLLVDKLGEFEVGKLCRQYFLDKMNPEFLPKYWDINFDPTKFVSIEDYNAT